jgi:predicted metal-dependent phosphoesterase TrpH
MMQFDLHVHSVRSHDSFSSIEGIVRAARKRGLAGIAVTDHGLTAPEELDRTAAANGLWIIRGNEVQTEIGDILGLFLQGSITQSKAAPVIDEIHDQGGIAVLAHPFKYRGIPPPALLEKLDAVEVVNARWRDLSALAGDPRADLLLRAVPGRTAGSDAHFCFEVGRACWVTGPIATQEELKRSLCRGEGTAQYSPSSGWLDEASQCSKFLKQPRARQLARIVYSSLRRLAFVPRSGLR